MKPFAIERLLRRVEEGEFYSDYDEDWALLGAAKREWSAVRAAVAHIQNADARAFELTDRLGETAAETGQRSGESKMAVRAWLQAQRERREAMAELFAIFGDGQRQDQPVGLDSPGRVERG